MNIIEQNLFKAENFDEALNLLVPPNSDISVANSFKAGLCKMPPENIIRKANSFIVQNYSALYFTFFLAYLMLSGEEPYIVSIDNGVITVSRDIAIGSVPRGFPIEDLNKLTYNFNTSAYLAFDKINNPRLKQMFDNWDITHKEIVDSKYYIKLLPACTLSHFDELYRRICLTI